MVKVELNCYCFPLVITGATDGIGKAYAKQVIKLIVLVPIWVSSLQLM